MIGGVFGLLGTMVSDQNLRATSWGIDGAALVVATALLALRFFREGNDIVAAGFLVFAIGEGTILSGARASLEGSVPSFAWIWALVKRYKPVAPPRGGIS
jgi:hypothetical protein